MNFYIADTHFFHQNVISFDNRPFKTLKEMHEALIANWNLVVTERDTVYVLGDFLWKGGKESASIIQKLKGSKRLLIGNHDKRWIKDGGCSRLFDEICDYKEIVEEIDNVKTKIVLSHFFMPHYNGHYHGAIHLHGHSHTTKEHSIELEIAKQLNSIGIVNRIYNVGCMHSYMDYTPRTLNEILEKA